MIDKLKLIAKLKGEKLRCGNCKHYTPGGKTYLAKFDGCMGVTARLFYNNHDYGFIDTFICEYYE